MKPIKILIMSVGPVEKNGTVKYLDKIGAADLACTCLPKQFEDNAEGYRKRGVEVFIYDEKKYINPDFEFFGFEPRNCGGVGRQGIAEAVEKFGDDYLCVEYDDDTGGICVRKSADGKSIVIKSREALERLLRGFNEFYEKTGVECMAKTGATPPSGDFVGNRKIFNNFIMRKGVRLNFDGFAALCSDDYRYNAYRNLLDATPMISTELATITFTQNQGDRTDGNAVLYNGDCSWKKSYALKMMFPWCAEQRIVKESNRVLFRENIATSKLYPPICVSEKGKIVGRVI